MGHLGMKWKMAVVCLGFAACCYGETVRELGWKDLKVQVEFEDPFEKLTQDQLIELSIYARIKHLKDQNKDVSDAMMQDMLDAEKKLRDQNVDIQGLLDKRAEITELRKKRAFAMDENLDGKVIRMPGYALALEYDGKKVTEFLLVPWVGACIHTPPPPANQIVFVVASEGFTTDSRFEPVWIEGIMQVGEQSKELYLVDGSSDINVGYSMSSAKIEKFTNAPKAVVRPANHDLNKEDA